MSLIIMEKFLDKEARNIRWPGKGETPKISWEKTENPFIYAPIRREERGRTGKRMDGRRWRAFTAAPALPLAG